MPVGEILVRSFLEPEPGLGQYVDLLTDSSNFAIIGRTLLVSLIVALVGLVLAYPYAYAMTRVSSTVRIVLVALVLLPFWTSLIARTFAWVVIFRPGGPLAVIGEALGFGERALLGTTAAVIVAMVQVLLPYMVLPLYNAMTSIDGGLMRAAASLGAKRATQFFTVFLPLSVPGIMAGTILVFVMSLGFYLTPSLVGSAQEPVVGQLIAMKVQRVLDFAGAGALAVVLLIVTFGLLGLMGRLTGGNPMGAIVSAKGVTTRGR